MTAPTVQGIGWLGERLSGYYHKTRTVCGGIEAAKCRRKISAVNFQGIPPMGFQPCPICYGAKERQS